MSEKGEVRNWIKEKVATLKPEQITSEGLRKLGLMDEYKQRFGNQNDWYITSKIRKAAGLQGVRKSKTPGISKEDMHNLKAAMSADFIAFAPGVNGKAFESVEEFQRFVEENKVYSGVYLFKKVPVNIKVDIDIGQ